MHAQDASPQHTSSYADPSFRRLFILELTPEYLREIAVAPGGWTRLAVTLCIYACHYPIVGALTITGLALFFYWIFPLYILGICAVRPFISPLCSPAFSPDNMRLVRIERLHFSSAGCRRACFAVSTSVSGPPRLWPVRCLLSLFFWCAWYFMQWGCFLVLFFALIHEFCSRERRIAPSLLRQQLMGRCSIPWTPGLSPSI